MPDRSINTCHRLLICMLLTVCSVLIEAAWASEVDKSRVERGWSSMDAHLQSEQYKKSEAAVTSSSTDVRGQTSKPRQLSVHSIRSTDASRAPVFPSQPSMNHCGVVEHIEPVMLNSAGSDYSGSAIAGMVMIPTNQHGAKFFTEIVVPDDSGYRPLKRNIAEPVYYQISLMADDGSHHVVVQQTAPQFGPGETVRFNSDGFLEESSCVMREFRQTSPDK